MKRSKSVSMKKLKQRDWKRKNMRPRLQLKLKLREEKARHLRPALRKEKQQSTRETQICLPRMIQM